MQSQVASVPPGGNRVAPPIFAAWAASRLITSLGAILFSGLRPITDMERAIAVWPPSGDLGLWLNRLLLAPWRRWDAVWYGIILTGGFQAGTGATSFHPLYVILSEPLYRLGFDPTLSLMVTSSLAALGFFWIFCKYAALDLPEERLPLGLFLLATCPLALILFAPYPESVFLFFSTLALYKIRQRRWLAAALATCAASLARQQGILLALPMLWQAWEESGRSLRGLSKAWRGWLSVLSSPSGLLIWTAVRIAYLHEGALDLRSLQTFIYSALLSTSAKDVVPDQAIMWPWNAFAAVLPRLMHGPDVEDVVSIGLGAGFVLLLIVAWRYMQPGERLYSLALTLLAFSLFTGLGRVYLGLPRHLFLAVPVFVGLAAALRRRWQQIPFLGIQVALQLFMLMLYVTNLWIP